MTGFTLLLLASCLTQAQEVSTAPHFQLAEKLGSADFRERESAQSDLLAIGADALPALFRIAARELERPIALQDVEILIRAKRLVSTLRDAKTLAPTTVTLAVDGVKVSEVLRRITAQTGFYIQTYPETLDDVPISLKVENIAFWSALAKICVASGNHISVDSNDSGFTILRGELRLDRISVQGALCAFALDDHFTTRKRNEKDVETVDFAVLAEPSMKICSASECGTIVHGMTNAGIIFRDSVPNRHSENLVSPRPEDSRWMRASLFKPIPSPVGSVTRLRAVVELHVLERGATVRFINPHDGDTAEVLGGTIRLTSFHADPILNALIIELDGKCHPWRTPLDIGVTVRTESGKKITEVRTTLEGEGTSFHVRSHFSFPDPGEKLILEVKAPERITECNPEFIFDGIGL